MYLFYKNNMKTSPKIMNINVYIMLEYMQLNITFIKKGLTKTKTKVENKEGRQLCIGKVVEL